MYMCYILFINDYYMYPGVHHISFQLFKRVIEGQYDNDLGHPNQGKTVGAGSNANGGDAAMGSHTGTGSGAIATAMPAATMTYRDLITLAMKQNRQPSVIERLQAAPASTSAENTTRKPHAPQQPPPGIAGYARLYLLAHDFFCFVF